MTKTPQTNFTPVVHRFIEDVGNITQSFGVGRVIGQIYAYLYFSSDPKNLADMQSALGISKGSASTAVRQLEQWGAVRQVWVKGDRKDYYQAIDWFGKIIRNAVLDVVGKKMNAYTSLLDEVDAELSQINGDGQGEFIRDRVKRLSMFKKKAEDAWNNPLVKMLMK